MRVSEVRAWLSGTPPRAIDVAVACVVAVAMVLIISVADEPGANRPLDGLAYVLGLTVAAMLLMRRTRPLLALVGSIGAVLIYAGLNYPAFSLAVPLAAASYAAALAGHIRPAAAIVAFPLVVSAGYQSIVEGTSLTTVFANEILSDASLLAVVLLLGEAVRHRRAWAEEVRQRLERVEQDREREARDRVEAERLRIARELHDVVAHTIAGVNVQAAVAADLLEDDPSQAQRALRTIREQSRHALAELKATIGLMRGELGQAPRQPAPGLAGIDALIGHARAAGVDVEISVSGPVATLPAAVELTTYRIVQEALTNVVRHADAETARVTIRFQPDAIDVQVSDDGRVVPGPVGSGGYGLVGMRERAAALGGSLEAGPAATGGFCVSARLPTQAAPA